MCTFGLDPGFSKLKSTVYSGYTRTVLDHLWNAGIHAANGNSPSFPVFLGSCVAVPYRTAYCCEFSYNVPYSTVSFCLF